MNQYDPDDVDALIAAELTRHSATARSASSEPLGVHVTDWRNLSDDAASTVWVELRAWVEWFTVRYSIPVSVVPPCWWKHAALVEELSALHIAHQASFDEIDNGYGPIGWHERLTLAHPRLQRAGAGCASGHNETRPRSWSGATDETEWAAWISQSHAH